MKKVLLFVVCLLIGITSVSAEPMTIRKKLKVGYEAISIEFTGNFKNGELITGPVNIILNNGEKQISTIGNYNAVSSEITGIISEFIDAITTNDERKFICHYRLSNNETKDKILLKNLKKNMWHIVIEELYLHKYENTKNVKHARVLDYNDFQSTGNIFFVFNEIYKMYRDSSFGLQQYVEVTFQNGNKMHCRGNPKDYIWSNGDKYKGDMSAYEQDDDDWSWSVYKQIIPIKGKFTLNNGSIISSSDTPELFQRMIKILKDDVSKNTNLYIKATPTEISEVARKQLEEERLKKQREKEAAELKAKLEKQRQEQEERQKDLDKLNRLIRRYGYKYGKAIYDKEPMVGMTIEMVRAIHNSKGRINRYIRAGKEITILSYGGEFYSFLGVAGRENEYEYTFINGELVEYNVNEGSISVLMF